MFAPIRSIQRCKRPDRAGPDYDNFLLLFHGSLLPEVEVKGLDDEPGVLDSGIQVESESNHGTQGFTRRPTDGGSGLI
jgi:hypothetical protein